jgi:hypothetical protein
VSVDDDGNVYVTGDTDDTLPGETGAGGSDVFLRKYDSAGNVQWTRQFGTSSQDLGNSVSVDGSGNVYIAGQTFGTLPEQTNAGFTDAFVRKYDSAGTELWTRQFGTNDRDNGDSLSVDGSGNVYVSGRTQGSMPGQTNAGAYDVFVRKYDGAGTELWTRQFGSSGNEFDAGVSTDGNGNVYVAGQTFGVLPGQTSSGYVDTFLRKYDSAGTAQWTRQFGSNGHTFAVSVSVDASGSVYLVGGTEGTLPDQTSAGDADVFARKYDGLGTAQWTWQFGSNAEDIGRSVTVGGNGMVYVFGDTRGSLPGQTSVGATDVFLARLTQ